MTVTVRPYDVLLDTPRERKSGVRLAAATAAVALHALVLVWLVSNAGRLRLATAAPDRSVLELQLAPTTPQSRPRPSATTAATRLMNAPAHSTTAASVAPRPGAPTGPSPAPSSTIPPSPSSQTVGGARAATGPPAAAEGAGLRQALRGLVGCAQSGALDLTPAERARCTERLGLALRTAPRIDPIPAEKRADFDAVVAATEQARALPASAGHPQLLRDHGVDATIGLDCRIALGAAAGRVNRHRGIRLGFPPCPIHPPLSVLTAETRAPTPDTLREREEDARKAAALDAPPIPRP